VTDDRLKALNAASPTFKSPTTPLEIFSYRERFHAVKILSSMSGLLSGDNLREH
jgi:hypothetical protein